jgi:hypothetical protein
VLLLLLLLMLLRPAPSCCRLLAIVPAFLVVVGVGASRPLCSFG